MTKDFPPAYLKANRLFLFSLIVIVVLFALSSPAKADERCDFLQFTCIPELDYFAVRTVTMDRQTCSISGADSQESALKKIQDNYQMYNVGALSKPYVCNLPNLTVSSEIADFMPGHERGECAVLDQFNVLIRVNGEVADKYSAYGVGRCRNPETHVVEIGQYHLIDTTIPDILSRSRKITYINKVIRIKDGKVTLTETYLNPEKKNNDPLEISRPSTSTIAK
jgi:hypothetical protein